MKQTINLDTFREAFKALRPDNFSYNGLEALYDMLTDLEADTGQEMELDVIALCCDFTESTLQEVAQNYGIELDEVEEYLQDNTFVIQVDEDTVIYQNF